MPGDAENIERLRPSETVNAMALLLPNHAVMPEQALDRCGSKAMPSEKSSPFAACGRFGSPAVSCPCTGIFLREVDFSLTLFTVRLRCRVAVKEV